MTEAKWWKTICLSCIYCAATASGSPAQVFTTLLNFMGSNGNNPRSSLVQGPDGNFYGTTASGGYTRSGTVFKITPSGTLTDLYSFCQNRGKCNDGINPDAGLVLATDGNFYGTTGSGGPAPVGAGTVFKITPQGKLTTLYGFCAQKGCADGSNPFATLVQADDGNFYGTTFEGGANAECYSGVKLGCGTVFQMTPEGKLATLYSFCAQPGCTDGAILFSGLVQASDGNFYGTTYVGGASAACSYGTIVGCGTVFQITPGGKLTTLYSFCAQTGCVDGALPEAGLVQGPNGNLYGTTLAGGVNSCGGLEVAPGCGTVFEITLGGRLTTLHSFAFDTGSRPQTALFVATDGKLYGTTSQSGGVNFGGTVFEITPGGNIALLHSFDDQGLPNGLIQATSGTFYGTTADGGTLGGACLPYGCGTVFSLSVGLGPYAETVPTSGSVKTRLTILGNNLTVP